MRNFFNEIGCNIFMNNMDNFIEIDFLSNFILSSNLFNFENNRIIFLVGLNLRVEIPILNSKLRKLMSSIKIFYIGLMGSYLANNGIVYIGNSINDLISVIKGKNKVNLVLFNNTCFPSFFFYYKIIGVVFLFGQSFYKIKLNFNIFKYMKN
jgi:hypothetical protein